MKKLKIKTMLKGDDVHIKNYIAENYKDAIIAEPSTYKGLAHNGLDTFGEAMDICQEIVMNPKKKILVLNNILQNKRTNILIGFLTIILDTAQEYNYKEVILRDDRLLLEDGTPKKTYSVLKVLDKNTKVIEV